MSISADVTFAIIPEWIIDKCSPHAVKLYVILWTYTGKDQRECWPSRKTLAGRLGVTDTTLDKYVRELKQAGAITATHRKDPEDGRLTSNKYQLHVSQLGGVANVAKVGSQAGLPVTRTIEQEGTSNSLRSLEVHTPSPRARKRNPLFDAVTEAWRPGRTTDQLTETEADTVGRCVAELARVRATPEEVALARETWDNSDRWHKLTFTPDALKKHWGDLISPPRPASISTKRHASPRDNVAISMESVRVVSEMIRNGSSS